MTESFPLESTVSAPDSSAQSWGDRGKKVVFNKVTYVGLNYFVNAIGAAALAYVVERKFTSHMQSGAGKVGEFLGGKNTNSVDKLTNSAFGVMRAAVLTSVGTALLPVIKRLEDNRHRIEYGIGHTLDRLQEALGRGNAASKQNLADDGLLKRVNGSGDIQAVDGETATRLAEKHHVVVSEKGKTLFQEHILPWPKIIYARVAGFTAVCMTNALLGLTAGNHNPLLNYKKMEGMAADRLDKSLLSRLPLVNRLADRKLFAGLLVNDALLTVASSGVHCQVQKKLHKDSSVTPHQEPPPAMSDPDSTDISLSDAAPDAVRREILSRGSATGHVARQDGRKPTDSMRGY